MNLFVAQLPMHSTIEGNVARIVEALHDAPPDALLLTPELALTGFHRDLPALCAPEALRAGTEEVRAAVEATGVACALGHPALEHDRVHNRLTLLRPGQPDLSTDKRGLTPSEARFFTPGERAPWTFGSLRVGAALCREVLDHDELVADLAGCDLVLWPGYIQQRPDDDGPDDLHTAAARLARSLGAWVVQANWASACNDPSLRGMGGSVWLSPDGEVVRRAPADTGALLTGDFAARCPRPDGVS